MTIDDKLVRCPFAFYGEKEKFSWDVFLPECWHDLFWQMCGELADLLEHNHLNPKDLYFLQVKEKYGVMRVYWNFDWSQYELDEEDVNSMFNAIDTIISANEELSEMIWNGRESIE